MPYKGIREKDPTRAAICKVVRVGILRFYQVDLVGQLSVVQVPVLEK